MLTPKARVLAALRREPVDRVPIYMWLHPETARRLGTLLDIPAASVAEALGDDVRQMWVNNNYAMCGIVHNRDGEGHTDRWGIRWEQQDGFNQIIHFPLAAAPEEAVPAYRFPEAHMEELLGPWRKRRARPATISSAATSPPASLKCTGGCAAWRRR